MLSAASSGSSTSSANPGFGDYYREFSTALHTLEQQQPQKQHDDDTKSQELLKQCQGLLRLMAAEARTAEDPDVKFEWNERVKIYKFQLQAVQSQFDRDFLLNSSAAVAAAASLDATSTPINNNNHSQQRRANKEALDRSERRLAQQNELLERAKRSIAETEETSLEVMEEVQRNRETMESTQRHLGSLKDMTKKATDIITNMSKPWWLRKG